MSYSGYKAIHLIGTFLCKSRFDSQTEMLYIPTQKPGSYRKIHFLEKVRRNDTGEKNCFSCIILFCLSEGRKGKVRTLSYCVSALPQATILCFLLKKL